MGNTKGNWYPNFPLRMSEEMSEKIKFIANKNMRSINKEISYALQLYIEKYESENGEIETHWAD